MDEIFIDAKKGERRRLTTDWCENCNLRRSVCHVRNNNMTIHFCSECEAEYRQEYADWIDDMRRDR